jgi:hypothetical protein
MQRGFAVDLAKEFPIAGIIVHQLVVKLVLECSHVFDNRIPSLHQLADGPVDILVFCIGQGVILTDSLPGCAGSTGVSSGTSAPPFSLFICSGAGCSLLKIREN